MKLPRKPKRLRAHLKPRRRRFNLAAAVASLNTFLHGEPYPTHVYGVGYVSSQDPRYIDP